MTSRQKLFLKVAGGTLIALLAAAAFSAYLKPGMLVEFANLVFCS
jgi:hypothetical protein